MHCESNPFRTYIHSGSIFFRVGQQVLLHFSLVHHPPISPRFRILFIRRRHNSNLYLSWFVISCVNYRHRLNRNLHNVSFAELLIDSSTYLNDLCPTELLARGSSIISTFPAV